MSLRAPIVYCLPDDTARVARAAFPKGNAYLRVHEALGPLYTNPQFAGLFPKDGQPAIAPAQLALVTIFQFAEGLSDRQAADAVRGRIDWKYALCLPLDDPGFDASVLSEFRARLIAKDAETLLFETLLAVLKEAGLVKPRSRQRTDSTHVLAAIQVLNRLELVGETLRHALNTLATVVPAWLQSWVPADWFARYARRFEEYRLPDALAERTALAEQIGADGRHLLATIFASEEYAWLAQVPAVETLRRVWVQQFYAEDPVRWRAAQDLPPSAVVISSPYDPEARYSKKRETTWTGYKVHFTETCDDDTPSVVTDVDTTVATTVDHAVTAAVQARLAARGLAPREHLADTSYVTADHLVSSQTEHDCALLGPIHEDYSWQARAGEGFGAAQFTIDWERERAICPQGRVSRIWKPTRDSAGHDIINIRFDYADCRDCPARRRCVSSDRERALAIRPRPLYEALHDARRRQHTPEFREQYRTRAGIEGTFSQGVGLGDLRRTRYRGLAKTRLLHLLIATALNVLRVAAWLAERPRAHTRTSAFAALAPASG
jgi:transposase